MKLKRMMGIAGAIALTSTAVFADEAEQLRKDMEAMNERLAALEEENTEAKSGWQTKVRVKGDFRYRFQHADVEDTDPTKNFDKNIQRLRARLGVFADVNDFTEAAIGIRTGDSANSGNVTLGDSFDGKTISLSLAYLRLIPEEGKYGSLTMGKMKQPWKATTDLIWDSDVNPEGIAYAYDGKAGDTGLIGSLGHFKVADNSAASDVELNTIQGGVSQPFGDKLKGVLGASYYGYRNVDQLVAPPADVATGYRIAEGFAELGVKEVGPIPFKFYGNYVNNTAVDTENQGWCAGIKFGDAKKGKWEAKYDYRDLELFAAPGNFTDSDFADGGSGVKGHRIKAKYNFAKNLQGGLAYVYADRTPDGTITQDQKFKTLFLDLMVKF